jgi:hypothetical protein
MTDVADPHDDISARTARRALELQAALVERRRLARPEDYVYDKAQDAFWDLDDNTMHVAAAVDNSIPLERWRVVVTPAAPNRPNARPREQMVRPSADIARVENDQFVEAATWWPGKPQMIRDLMVDGAGFHPAAGRRLFNQYRPPLAPTGGVPARAEERWVAHVRKLWPDPREHEYFFDYCAHMLQRPEEKCNAALVLSGTQGIGKDAALLPVRLAIGGWNAKGIEPDQLFSAFKPFLQTVMLLVDEVRPSKDEFHASSMYNVLKPLIVTPPDTLPLEDKYARVRYVVNVLRVFITTNDWMSMYIPPEDRRMFILHSPLPARWHEAEGRPEYFREFFGWVVDGGGWRDVAAWLLARDLSRFDPKSQVVRTAGWTAVAQTWGEPDDAVAAALEALGHPEVLFGAELISAVFDDAEEVRAALKSPRKIGHRMQRAGYLPVAHPDGERGTWRFGRFKSRLAFARATSVGTGPDAAADLLRALRTRGMELGARRGQPTNQPGDPQ